MMRLQTLSFPKRNYLNITRNWLKTWIRLTPSTLIKYSRPILKKIRLESSNWIQLKSILLRHTLMHLSMLVFAMIPSFHKDLQVKMTGSLLIRKKVKLLLQHQLVSFKFGILIMVLNLLINTLSLIMLTFNLELSLLSVFYNLDSKMKLMLLLQSSLTNQSQ